MRAFRHTSHRSQASPTRGTTDAVLLTDPLNIRYATDATNMQLWNTHNPFRDLHGAAPTGTWWCGNISEMPRLSHSASTRLVKEVRNGAGHVLLLDRRCGRTSAADAFADQVVDLLNAAHCEAPETIAVSRSTS